MPDSILCSELPASVEHDARYFAERHCLIDCRGTLKIDRGSLWGYFVTVITLSHDNQAGPLGDNWGATVDRPVIVDRGAWIGSGALLYNCHIGEGAVIAAGTVVRSQDVAPFTMVAGNPAKVIARFTDSEWQYNTPRVKVLA